MAVADALVSKVLDLLTSVITSEVKLIVGVKQEVKMLTDNLRSIQAVLIDADKRQLTEKTVELWLHRLNDISYNMEDVLDEWSTEILKSKIEGDEYEYALKPKRSKVWSFFLSSCFCFHEVGFRRDIALKIKELNESLDVIAKEKDRYKFHLIKVDERVERVMSNSIVNMMEVKGRKNDKAAIIDLLLAESERNPHVISIVGMGGIGKTTLAKLVYNEDSVKTHFHERIWVCVSDPFDETRIAKEILESLSKSASNFVGLQRIVDEIHKHIEGKRFLLVLDDVWNEDSIKWERVEEYLKCGLVGSKILVTTRNENTARVMGCGDIVQLGLLSNEESWSVFSQVVFFGSSMVQDRSLEIIGRKIVGRCKGLPLAVKAIAGLLRFKESSGEWQSVLDSEFWELEKVEKEVLAPMRLSYYDLPSILKQCFLYCVIFPKDYKLSKKQLIGMWLSQGYLRETQSKDMQTVGDECFQNLSIRSFFQDFEEDEMDSGNTYCKMHDAVHDFAQSIVKNKECCSIEIDESREQRIEFDNNETRHLGVMLGKKQVTFPDNLEKLRSLIVLSLSCRVDLARLFSQLTFLRSLSLGYCGIREIPSNISKLIHLRQLDLSNNPLKELPETVCKLYNLQTLNVDKCSSLKALPRGIGKLLNLRCLYNFDWNLGSCLLPKEIGMLSDLCRLSMIKIEGEEDAYLSLRDLKNLNQLGGLLWIDWRSRTNNVGVEEAKEAHLKEKKNLKELILYFSEGEGGQRRKEEDEEILEALEPSATNLNHLVIACYKGRCSPGWIKGLSFLRKLKLWEWRNCEQFPHSLGKLPFLQSLAVGEFNSLKKVGLEFYGVMNGDGDKADAIILFPKLIKLEFNFMEEWEEWKEIDIDKKKKKRNINQLIKIMPSLQYLVLRCCPKLKAVPNYILQNTSVKLDINLCDALQQTCVTPYGLSPQAASYK